MKVCKFCKISKTVSSFRHSKLGYIRSYCRDCEAKEIRKYQLGPGRTKIKTRYLRRNYNRSFEQYQSLIDAQQGTCAICNKVPDAKDRWTLQIDHCHKTGKVRGLLCVNCNTSLGKFNDDPVLLQKASKYLCENS